MSKIIGQAEIELMQLVPSKFNVRHRSNEEDVTELANSIEEHGVIEPILVRKTDGKYEVIAGGLRVRAAKEAGLRSVPAIIKEMTNEEARTESLIENIQRHTLNPLDEAEAFADLYQYFKSSKAIAEMVGCSEKRVGDALKVKGLIETLKSRSGAAKTNDLLEKASTKSILSDVARVADRVYKDQPDKTEKLTREVIQLPREEARKVLDQVRIYPDKSIQKIKEEVLYAPQSINLNVQFGSKIVKAMDEACKAHHSSREEIVQLAVEYWLKDEKYL